MAGQKSFQFLIYDLSKITNYTEIALCYKVHSAGRGLWCEVIRYSKTVP